MTHLRFPSVMTMVWLLRRAAWYLGWLPMVLSVALLAGWGVLSQQHSAQRAQWGTLEHAVSRLAAQPLSQAAVAPGVSGQVLVSDHQAEPDDSMILVTLWQQLPSFDELSPRMMHIASMAQKRQIALNVGDYQWQAHVAPRAVQATAQDIQQFDMRFTIQADYTTCRQFIRDVLTQYPSMALTALELRKNETTQPVIDATLTFSVFIRGRSAHGA